MARFSRLNRSFVALSLCLLTAAASNGWDEALRGTALDRAGMKQVHAEEFSAEPSFNGPILWAKQHADVGLEKFDPPGGYAYSVKDGLLNIRAYQDGAVIRSGNVQSTNANQAYHAEKIVPGKRGYTCAGCYWEARVKFPRARGTWGAFWLLTPDDPKKRGHLEVDGIEYYGLGDRRGHHHTIHRWATPEEGGHKQQNDYTGMDAIADFDWHVYGIDMRGISKLNGKPAVVMYFDGKEVGRIAPALGEASDFFTWPFYYNLTLSINPKDPERLLPQTMQVDYVRVWK